MSNDIAEFRTDDGSPVSVNMSQVAYFRPAGHGALIVFANGLHLIIDDSYDAVAEAMSPERQTGL